MPFLIVYILGVVVGLVGMSDRWPARLAIALVWPLGPMAFLTVVPILLIAAAILWPFPILGTAGILAAIAWMLR